MALILKSLVGYRSSNSYVSLAESSTILAEKYSQEELIEWTALPSIDKIERLILSTNMLNSLPFRGTKAYRYQALSFPRDAIQKTVDYIPDDIKRAQVLIAFKIVHESLKSTSVSSSQVNYGRVNRLSFGGIFHVGLASDPLNYGGLLSNLGRAPYMDIYLLIAPYMSQIRGCCLENSEDEWFHTLSSTTTTSTTTTSTTTSSSTTTTTTITI